MELMKKKRAKQAKEVKQAKQIKQVHKNILIAIGGLAIVFLILLGIYNWFEIKYSQKIYPGVRIGSMSLGGKTTDQARIMLNQRLDQLNQDGLVFEYATNKSTIYPVVNKSIDGDIVDILIDFNTDKTIEKAMAVGKSRNFISDLGTRFLLFIAGEQVNMVFGADKDKITKELKKSFASIEPANAGYYIADNQLKISPEHTGEKLDYEIGLKKMDNDLKQLNFSKIVLKSKGLGVPEFTSSDCEQMRGSAQGIIDLAPVALKYENNAWPLTPDVLAGWIVISKDNSDKNKPVLFLQLDKDKIADYLEKEIEPKIDESPIPPKFVLKDGKLQEATEPKTGLELNIFLAVENLADLPNNHIKQLNLSVPNFWLKTRR